MDAGIDSPGSTAAERARTEGAGSDFAGSDSAGSDGTEENVDETAGAGARNPVPGSPDGVRYSERLSTPWWWYIVGAGIAALFAAEFRIAGIKVTEWLPFGILLPLAVLIVWWMGRSRVEVSGGELRVRGAHLPLHYVTGAIGLDANILRRVVGREGDPSAFVSIRPWIGPGVQVWIDDDDDPTPYWVISTRHPDRVVDALRAPR